MQPQMQQRDLILTIIGACSASPDFGRTALQKVAYLYATTYDHDLGHRAYYYGPFSAAVERDAEALGLAGLVEEQAETLGFYNSSGRPATKYTYDVSEPGNERLARLRETYPDETAQVESFVEIINGTFGSLNQDALSTAAKTLYITREQAEPVTVEGVTELAKDFGWNLPVPKIRKVVDILAQLHLVEASPASGR